MDYAARGQTQRKTNSVLSGALIATAFATCAWGGATRGTSTPAAAGQRAPVPAPTAADRQAQRASALASAPSSERGDARAADVWRPAEPPQPLPRRGFRISLSKGDGSTGAYLEVDPEGHLYNYVAGGPRPTEGNTVARQDFSVRRADDGRVAFFLRPSDGELIDPDDTVAQGSRPAQDLHCHLTVGAELHCTHDDGDESFVLWVRDGHIMGRHDGAPDQQRMNAVEPDPTTADERRLVLFLWAFYMVPSDTGSHDGDTGFFSGPN